MYGRVNLRRCARGYINAIATAQFVTGLLSNPSGTVEYLLVWQLSEVPFNSQTVGLSYQQISALGTTYKTQPIVPTDAPPPGILSSGNLTTSFTPDFSFATPAEVSDPWPFPLPLAVIPPGWSLAMQTGISGGGPLSVRLYWEAIFPERLISPYIGDPAIDP